MHTEETLETWYRVPAHEVIWTTLGPGALQKMAATLRASRTGWIVPVGGGVTHTFLPIAETILGRKRWTVAHWVTVEGHKPERMDHIDDFGAFDEISLAVDHAVEMTEFYAANPMARTACPWCFRAMDRNELAAGHDCPV